jgi:hypothetical protein
VARKAAFGLAASAAVLGALAASHGHGQEPATAPVAAVSTVSSAQDTKAAVAGATAGDTSAAKDAHLTTTFHHPFYDETQSAFVDAKDLHTGDVLQTPTGTAEVTSVRLYHANTTTYDLTIGTLHTYYVEAGDTPVLVHNCGGSVTGHPSRCTCADGGIPKVRNGKLAGDVHPKTSVPFDENGFPDFSAWRHPDVPDVRIELTGSRGRDFTLANKAAGLDSTPEGYTWHHHQDPGLMQLIETDAHRLTAHTGGFSGGGS